MPIITTKILGENVADPKPATCINYAGQPMKPGDAYNGRPEHMDKAAIVREDRIARLRNAKRSPMSAERRAAFGKRMRAYWAARKAKADA
jgi:hypothetical protein